MFDSLADQIRHDDEEQINRGERIIRWAAVVVFSIMAFGGLYWGIRMLE